MTKKSKRLLQDFENKLFSWIDQSLAGELPKHIKAFNFNLFQPVPAHDNDPKFGIELIGSGEFNLEDADWACDEIFEASPRQLLIPLIASGHDWKTCLEHMTGLVKKYLCSSSPGALVLKQYQGVGIGFVDGELNILYCRDQSPLKT